MSHCGDVFRVPEDFDISGGDLCPPESICLFSKPFLYRQDSTCFLLERVNDVWSCGSEEIGPLDFDADRYAAHVGVEGIGEARQNRLVIDRSGRHRGIDRPKRGGRPIVAGIGKVRGVSLRGRKRSFEI